MKLNITDYTEESLKDAGDAECEEILLDQVIGNVEDPVKTVTDCVKKLRHDGTIIITGPEAFVIAEAFVIGAIDINRYNQLVKHANMFTIDTVRGLLESLGLRITKKRIEDFEMVIEGTRP